MKHEPNSTAPMMDPSDDGIEERGIDR